MDGGAIAKCLERINITGQQPIVISLSVVEQGLVHIDGRAIVGVDECKTQHHGVHLGEYVANRPEIAEGFAHLFAVDVDKAVVQPMMNHRRMTGVALALTNFCFVVREAEVVTAPVDVELFAEVVHGHRRALDVPARPARAPRRVPRGFARFGGLPQGEVLVISLSRACLTYTASCA